MPRKNPEKLSEEYPIVKVIKMKLANEPDVKKPAIEGYDRRVRGSPFIMVHLQYIQQLHNKNIRFLKMANDEKQERRRIECCIEIQADRAKRAEAEVAILKERLDLLTSCPSLPPCHVPSLKVLAARALPKHQMLPSV